MANSHFTDRASFGWMENLSIKGKKYFWYLLHSRCQCANFIFHVFKSLHLINHTNEQCMLVYLFSVDVSIECMPVLNNHNLFLWYDCQHWNIPLQRGKQVSKFCFYCRISFHCQDKFWMEWTTFQKKKKNCVNCLFKSWCKCDNFTIRACKNLCLIHHTNELCMLVYLVSVDVFIDCTHELNNHNLSLRYDRHYRNIPLQREKQVFKICFHYKNSFYRQGKFWMEWTTFQKKEKKLCKLFI